MNQAELLTRARAFSAGPPAEINGIILTAEVLKKMEASRDVYEVQIAYRGVNRWAITNGRTCLNKKTGDWEYEPLSSSRTEEYLEATRFESAESAFDFWFAWRDARIKVLHEDQNCIKFTNRYLSQK